jgi:hypothetical protein
VVTGGVGVRGRSVPEGDLRSMLWSSSSPFAEHLMWLGGSWPQARHAIVTPASPAPSA